MPLWPEAMNGSRTVFCSSVSTVARICIRVNSSATGPLCLKPRPEALKAAEICRTCFHCSSPPWAAMVVLTRSCMVPCPLSLSRKGRLFFKDCGADGLLKGCPVLLDELGDRLWLAASDLLNNVD